MDRYCCGYLFTSDFSEVVLVKKNRPPQLAGLLNGVGGKIEPGETAHDAMVREFDEETGMAVPHWINVGCLRDVDKKFSIEVFYNTSNRIEVESRTDEPIVTVKVADIREYEVNDEFRAMLDLILSGSEL